MAEPNNLKRPLEMIAEWKKGCSIAGPQSGEGDSPANCFECTAALIDALESVLREPSVEMIEDVAGSQEWDYRNEADDCRQAARDIYKTMTGAIPPTYERLSDAPPPPPAPSLFVGQTSAPVRPISQWRRDRAGTVDDNGNILGAEPGVAFGKGIIWLKNEDEAARAERFGWQRTGRVVTGGRFSGLVQVERP